MLDRSPTSTDYKHGPGIERFSLAHPRWQVWSTGHSEGRCCQSNPRPECLESSTRRLSPRGWTMHSVVPRHKATIPILNRPLPSQTSIATNRDSHDGNNPGSVPRCDRRTTGPGRRCPAARGSASHSWRRSSSTHQKMSCDLECMRFAHHRATRQVPRSNLYRESIASLHPRLAAWFRGHRDKKKQWFLPSRRCVGKWLPPNHHVPAADVMYSDRLPSPKNVLGKLRVFEKSMASFLRECWKAAFSCNFFGSSSSVVRSVGSQVRRRLVP